MNIYTTSIALTKGVSQVGYAPRTFTLPLFSRFDQLNILTQQAIDQFG